MKNSNYQINNYFEFKEDLQSIQAAKVLLFKYFAASK
jgi:hypothetical protein